MNQTPLKVIAFLCCLPLLPVEPAFVPNTPAAVSLPHLDPSAASSLDAAVHVPPSPTSDAAVHMSRAEAPSPSAPVAGQGSVQLLAPEKASAAGPSTVGQQERPPQPSCEMEVELSEEEKQRQVEKDWNPPHNKALVAMCLFGRLTNQLMCMRAYLMMAAVSNRTLVVPRWGVAHNRYFKLAYNFTWDVPVDWNRMRRCLEPHHGPHTVMLSDDYAKARGLASLNITRVQNLKPGEVFQHGTLLSEFLRLNKDSLTFPEYRDWHNTSLIPGEGSPRLNLTEATSALQAIKDDIITLGEMVCTNFYVRPPAFFSGCKGCLNLWRPHEAILRFVDGAIASWIQGEYGAAHLRRGDFYDYRSGRGKKRGKELATDKEYKPLSDLGKEYAEGAKKANLTSFFVATNARRMEYSLLKSIMLDPSISEIKQVLSLMDLLSKRDWLEQQPWAKQALELEARPGSNGLVFSLLDKFFCVRSKEFWGTPGSTLSMVIALHIRQAEKTGKNIW